MPLEDLIKELQALQKQGSDRAFVGSSGKLVIGVHRDHHGDAIIITMRLKS